MKAIIGLGNPGLRFRNTPHNLGYRVVKKLAKAQKIRLRRNAKTFNCLLGEGRIGSQRVMLCLPLTFMNLSAQAVAPIVKRKRISLQNLLIICDDVNLALGKIRIRAKGSDGGHKGLRSIIEGLRSQNFARLRIGMGAAQRKTEKAKPCIHPRAKGRLTKYVLGHFNKKQMPVIKETTDKAVNCCRVWTKEGIISAMNSFN